MKFRGVGQRQTARLGTWLRKFNSSLPDLDLSIVHKGRYARNKLLIFMLSPTDLGIWSSKPKCAGPTPIWKGAMPYKEIDKQKEAQHRSYVKNKESVYERSKGDRESKQRFLNGIKSYPCTDCETSWPSCAMQLDHLDASEKVSTVSKLVRSAGWTRLVDEIMKCDLVCACCHSLRTASRLNNSSCI